MFKGRVAELLRHPQGSDVLTELYDAAPQAARNAMCAECYGREYALFEGVGGDAPLAGQVCAGLCCSCALCFVCMSRGSRVLGTRCMRSLRASAATRRLLGRCDRC